MSGRTAHYGRMNLKCFVGQKAVLMPRREKICLMASEVPLMYRIVVEAMIVGSGEGEVQLCDG